MLEFAQEKESASRISFQIGFHVIRTLNLLKKEKQALRDSRVSLVPCFVKRRLLLSKSGVRVA